jgi:Zn finger protein HypA/HybF involved in hydrogenase expression
MKSVCYEIKTKCNYCGNPLVMNAAVTDIYCKSCNKVNEVTEENWISLLEDPIKEGPSLAENEGQTSTTFMGQYQYSIMYGNQKARCEKCKESVPEEKILEYTEAGIYKCAKCENDVSIRPAPEFLKSKYPQVQYLVAEDENMLAKNDSGYQPANNVKPVIFTCPSCGGALKVDGSNRMLDCEFCKNTIYLPDDLWFRLHPPKVVERWYLVLK